MNQPQFDLWRDPWIHVLDGAGRDALLGIGETLRRAHELRSLSDPSPLAVVGIHRLLVAILQDALRPESTGDLTALWRLGRLPEEKIATFEAQYGHLFDLFSVDRPFMQSADLGLIPAKGDKVKSVLYLHHEWPAGSETTHYRHGTADDVALCPACVAVGLVALPAFATAGGSGIKPSINGVPPIYVLPQGETLAASLIASLVEPRWQPKAADKETDEVWWRHEPMVGYKHERLRVGYLHSLTFPVRQVRLHPICESSLVCSRCGAATNVSVRTMVYNMGESRPKEAAWWQDPFVAYKQRKKGTPLPLRPLAGRVLWRDYAALFLDVERDNGKGTVRPNIVEQINVLADRLYEMDHDVVRVRCIGLRTDMKAKVFEWIDQGLDAPLSLLHSQDAAHEVMEAINFCETAESTIGYCWTQSFAEGRSGRHKALGTRLKDLYWAWLSAEFGSYVARWAKAADCDEPDVALAGVRWDWSQRVVRSAQQAFEESANQLGDNATSLRQRVTGEAKCRALLLSKRKEYASHE